MATGSRIWPVLTAGRASSLRPCPGRGVGMVTPRETSGLHVQSAGLSRHHRALWELCPVPSTCPV